MIVHQGRRRLGILGGGQLGWMIAMEAQRLGIHTSVMDAGGASCPAARAAQHAIQAPLDDVESAERLAREADVVTVETEHVDYRLLQRLEAITEVRPAARVLQIVQDRLNERRFLQEHGFPQTAFRALSSAEEAQALGTDLAGPTIVKGRLGGYDGKGQARAEQPQTIAEAWQAVGQAPAVVEDVVPFAKEISVLVGRGADGGVRVYPVAENLHLRHILHLSIAPARIDETVRRRAVEIGVGIAEALGHVGVVGTEMFVLDDGEVLVNEIAPRVHNSGHYTFGACVTSQFEQHARAVCGLPLGAVEQMWPAVMLNLLGDLWARGEPDWNRVLAHDAAKLYLYGKAPAKPGRKMGHVLCLQPRLMDALAMAEGLHQALASAAGGP